MDILNKLNSPDTKTVDYFINSKVDDLIERSVVEGKKRKQVETKIADEVSDPSSKAGLEYLSSIADFSDFPKYTGRGVQDTAPDIDGNCLIMWFSETNNEEIEQFIAEIVNAGFLKCGQDYVKIDGEKKLTMSISSSQDKLRIFYKKG